MIDMIDMKILINLQEPTSVSTLSQKLSINPETLRLRLKKLTKLYLVKEIRGGNPIFYVTLLSQDLIEKIINLIKKFNEIQKSINSSSNIQNFHQTLSSSNLLNEAEVDK